MITRTLRAAATTLLFVLAATASMAQISLDLIADGIPSPVDIQFAPGQPERAYIVSRDGSVYIVDDIYGTPAIQPRRFLVLDDSVRSGGEQGMLGMAFHPDYEANGQFFVYYTAEPDGRTEVNRYERSSDPDSADVSTELDIIDVDQFATNHNGGPIRFGSDGYLYIGLGDGGGGGDPEEYGQDREVLLGSILRLDIDTPGPLLSTCSDGDANYGIPADNPYLDNPDGFCEEIYAHGLRNPWRFSFGPDDRMWVADVGQGAREEISWVENGGNYGWDCKEGTRDYELTGCDVSELIDPVWEYDRSSDLGGRSITGGFVATRTDCPALLGRYVYADYATSHMWALDYSDTAGTDSTLIMDLSRISSFGQDEAGYIYVARLFPGTVNRLNCSDMPSVSLKIEMQGPEDGAAMTTDLNAGGLLPVSNPYRSDENGNRGGQEFVSPGFFGNHPDIVDWVVVELRAQDNPARILTSRAAFVKADGTVVDIDGTSEVSFLGVDPGEYSVAVWHRNHLAVLSSETVLVD